MTQVSLLDVQHEGEILYVKMNRPEKRNAINDRLLQSIEQVLDGITSSIKCMILHAEGDHFSAGLDLSQLQEKNLEEGLFHSRMWHRVMNKIQYGQTPVVAVLKGACVGGGLELAAACHIRVAETSTFFALPEGQRGIFVGGGASIRLPGLIGIGNMTDMMLTGRVYYAAEQTIAGFSQYVVPESQGLEKATELAKKIATNTAMTNYAVMHVLPAIHKTGTMEGAMMESLIAAIAQESVEAKQRLRDFLEGRAKKIGE